MDMKRRFNTEKSSLTMTRTQRVPLLLSVAAAVSVMSGSVMAQSLLEEVVVTAQKRDQGLQDVGIAVSAFTGDQLRAFDATDSFDIAAYTPGVHISGNLAGQNTQFTIRGVTQNDFNDIIESPNAVYLDEGYVAIAQAQTFALLDLDRVEILKGPQGTLFGRMRPVVSCRFSLKSLTSKSLRALCKLILVSLMCQTMQTEWQSKRRSAGPSLIPSPFVRLSDIQNRIRI